MKLLLRHGCPESIHRFPCAGMNSFRGVAQLRHILPDTEPGVQPHPSETYTTVAEEIAPIIYELHTAPDSALLQLLKPQHGKAFPGAT